MDFPLINHPHHPFFPVHFGHRRLNAAIKPIWDHLDAGVRKIIEDEIRPALQQRLGKRLGRSTSQQKTTKELGRWTCDETETY